MIIPLVKKEEMCLRFVNHFHSKCVSVIYVELACASEALI